MQNKEKGLKVLGTFIDFYLNKNGYSDLLSSQQCFSKNSKSQYQERQVIVINEVVELL